MKAIVLFCTFVISISLVSAQEQNYSNKELLEMNIFELCEALGIPGKYNDRYDAVILPLCEEGVVLFDGSLNPYVTEENSKEIEELGLSCYKYVGSSKQNLKLIRNIVHNRHLFENGRLKPNAASQWQIVD